MAQYDIRHSITSASAFVLFAVIALINIGSSVAGSTIVSGSAVVIDGHAPETDGRRFTLHAIAAPHLEQACEWPDQTIWCGDVARTVPEEGCGKACS